MATNKPYDVSQNRANIVHAPTAAGLSVPGTAASNTVLLRIPIASTVTLNHMRYRRVTGGTAAAGPNVTIGKSLAGTGAASAIGTIAFTTAADGTVSSLDLTATQFEPGDEIVLTNVAGTATSSPAIVFSIAYKDLD